VNVTLVHPLAAQVAHRYGWSGFWILLILVAVLLGVIVYLLFSSQPPSGPKIGE
jgi:uncharacterized membrane protein YhaH (DUF805 family)